MNVHGGIWNVHDGIWRVPCQVVRVIDADTIEVDADLGWGVWKRKLAVRIVRLWSPELSTVEGQAAAAFARSILPVGERVTLHSRWVLTFSRVVGSLYLADGTAYIDHIVDAGFGVRL